jgi:cation transport protein ChaC
LRWSAISPSPLQRASRVLPNWDGLASVAEGHHGKADMSEMRPLDTKATRRRSAAKPVLTRALLEAGGAREIYERDAPGIRLTTEAERAACLAETLARRPQGEVWVFGYGSLIWNPALKAAGRRTARVDGWHRAFCMSIVAGRARPATPGLMLALDAGGFCRGTAYRLDENDVVSELTMLWRREMLCRDAYLPIWVELIGDDGTRFGHAIAFTMNSRSEKYAGNMPIDTVVHRLATAAGGLGSCADYLFQTRDGLHAHGIPDAHLDLLAARVAAVQSSRPALRVA